MYLKNYKKKLKLYIKMDKKIINLMTLTKISSI